VNPQDAWNAAYNQLELQFDRATFDTWLRPAVFLGYDGTLFAIGVPNSYARDMCQHRLYRNIRRVLSDVYGTSVELRFEVHKLPVPAAEQEADMPLFKLLARQQDDFSELNTPALRDLVASPRQPDLPESDLNPRYTFERFIANKSCQLAYEAARAVSEYPGTVYNPLLIHGGVGLGKSHLLQAIAHVCAGQARRTLYISAEAFTNDLILAIQQRTTAMFREKYRTVDILLMDDIQFIGGKESTQEEFFHTFNALINFNKQIVLACDRHPRELATLADRLKSRFQGGLVVDVQPPEYETRIAILQMWAQERQITLNGDALDMIARRAPGNVRELEGVFNQIVAQSHLAGGTLTLPKVETTLERFMLPRNQLTPVDIIEAIAQQFHLHAADLTGKKRTEYINEARQVAMYLCRELTECSLPQIGDYFGGRSHTTVLHGCNKVAEQMAQDSLFASKVQKMRRLAASK
jgi:chromosomal replication initiator protein